MAGYTVEHYMAKIDAWIYDDEETKTILKFFFDNDHAYIENITAVSERLRKYGQAVLVMAVDLSFAMGFVNTVFNNFFMQLPKGNFRLVLAKLTREAKEYWFENADYKKLKNPKIYESIRVQTSISLKSEFKMYASDLAHGRPVNLKYAFSKPSPPDTIWVMS